MSKMYQLNRMGYGYAAGDPWLTGLLKGAGKLVGGLFKKKGVQAVVQTAGKVARSPVGQAALYAGAGMATGQLFAGGSGGRGASGSFAPRRAKGITARELRGYRKVANLLHREGMVSRRARGRK